MNRLTYLNIEIGDECPLTGIHPKCPRNADRFNIARALGADRINANIYKEPITVDDAEAFYRYCVEKHGFQGLLAPQFYNEPLATRPALLDLMRRLPEARFCIRTNGVLLDDGPECTWIIEHAEEVWITAYPQCEVNRLDRLLKTYRQAHKVPVEFDDRILEDVKPHYNPAKTFCIRPEFELDVDYYGNVHPCCGDWRGEIEIGNIKTQDYNAVISNWKLIKDKLAKLINPMTRETYKRLPHICKACMARTPVLGGRLAE